MAENGNRRQREGCTVIRRRHMRKTAGERSADISTILIRRESAGPDGFLMREISIMPTKKESSVLVNGCRSVLRDITLRQTGDCRRTVL